MSPNLNRTEFLDLGQHCSSPSCHQLDFLPFKCPSCALPYCGEHWRPPSGHECAMYDPAKEDNRIPSCPLCSLPISIPTNTDPNLTMDQHLCLSCPTLHPNLPTKPKHANLCAERKCKTKMIVPITCNGCGGRFCAKHRFEGDHACAGKVAASAGGKGGASGKSKMGLSGLAALRRAQEAIKLSTNASNSHSPIPLGRKGNPILISDSEPSSDSDIEILTPPPAGDKAKTGKGVKAMASVGVGRKVDKRALAEQESQRRGLEARAKKGLLTEDEKLRYATLKALDQKKGGGGKNGEGCRLS
ncbi:hypothetical protein BCR35DRAFT_276729 [Leucosporidium creatinivorum]|uniref:AN1-type domain-containing protein n=1 Tax=Leucosporidium creatinivorum TaxID=106004 RepID=A0A1Y2FWH1_9BASI|nr:hypothetical protein BCR35DRAFT_276729 [Leucosporidium creatinivorum]